MIFCGIIGALPQIKGIVQPAGKIFFENTLLDKIPVKKSDGTTLLRSLFLSPRKQRKNCIEHRIICPIYGGSDQLFIQQCPCCRQRLIRLFESVSNQGLDVFGHHALIPSRRMLSTMVLSDMGPCSNCSLSSKTVVMTRSLSKPTSHAMSRIQRSIF